MADITEFGTSQSGLQTLALLPTTFNRIFVRLSEEIPESTVKTGTLLVSAYYPGEDRHYIFKTMPFYRGAIAVLGLPPIAEGSLANYGVQMQWREGGLGWVFYGDDQE